VDLMTKTEFFCSKMCSFLTRHKKKKKCVHFLRKVPKFYNGCQNSKAGELWILRLTRSYMVLCIWRGVKDIFSISSLHLIGHLNVLPFLKSSY
jgi:hypothetical protein